MITEGDSDNWMMDKEKESDETMSDAIKARCTPIIEGDWKLVVHDRPLEKPGFRRYHKHGEEWYCVVRVGHFKLKHRSSWKCGDCGEAAPDHMEGYIDLARWAYNADA